MAVGDFISFTFVDDRGMAEFLAKPLCPRVPLDIKMITETIKLPHVGCHV